MFGVSIFKKGYQKFFKNFEKTYLILKKFTENFGRDFKLWGIFKILWHLDENQFCLNFNKNVHKIFLGLWKYFEKIWEIPDIFCKNKFQVEENHEKITCERWSNFWVVSENFQVFLKTGEEILKKCEDSLQTMKFVFKLNCLLKVRWVCTRPRDWQTRWLTGLVMISALQGCQVSTTRIFSSEWHRLKTCAQFSSSFVIWVSPCE